MAPRPNWKGYLKLSLVSCPVALYPATTTSERVSFRTLNRATGNRVRRQIVDEQTGESVESEDQVKGYEVAKGEYIMIEDDELKAVQIESNHTIDIERFVPRAEIDELYLDTPYYLAPTDRVGEEAFAVIREAMRAEKMVGLARVVLFRRERIMMLEPRGKGIVGDQPALRQRGARGQRLLRGDPRPRAAQGDAGARQAHHREDDRQVRARTQFEDRYENALIELIRSKQKGTPIKPQPTHRQANVINLMDALRRSVEGDKAKPAAGEGAKKREGRREGRQGAGGTGPRRAQGQGAHEEGRVTGRVVQGSSGRMPSAPLRDYHQKRNFTRTAEPRGKLAGSKAEARRRSVRRPQARRPPPALRPAPRARRRAEELGGHARAEPVARRTSAWRCAPRTTRSTMPSSRAGSPRASTARAASSSGIAAAGPPRATRTSSSPRAISSSSWRAASSRADGTSCT